MHRPVVFLTGGHKAAHDGNDALRLLLRRDGPVPRARRLATDVDDVGALVKHLEKYIAKKQKLEAEKKGK